ncbi:shikimate dehydrogenase [Methanosarcinales archaeon]|nr:MAG: shikimate dehydrogenase [Methanosarcinales archaeon]
MKRLIGIIGHPVHHSLSPTMHNAVLKYLGLDVEYLAFDVLPEELGHAVVGAKALGFLGLNITIPHKVEVMKFCTPDKISSQIGAVNTIKFDSEIQGFNTDATGAYRSLKEAGVEVKGTKVLIIEAGGVHRAISYILHIKGAEVVVANRTVSKAKEICDRLGTEYSGLDKLPQLVRWADIIINTTSVGMREDKSLVPKRLLDPTKVVFDIVYNPVETRLLRDAREVGAKTIDGVKMLVYQGAESFRIWTGIEPPTDLMEKAVRNELKNKN